MRVHYIQHVTFENLANIEKWINAKQYTLTSTKLYEDAIFPDMDSFDFLIIMGGPMNIYEDDKYPWLKQEKDFINNAIKSKKLVLGICLGAQLIADILGASIYKNKHPEIGWFPITLSENINSNNIFKNMPTELDVFHWHGDTFDLPENSTLLASSEACVNQGFIYKDHVIGLQFHLEASKASVERLIQNCSDDIYQADYIQDTEEMLKYNHFNELEDYLFKLLNNCNEFFFKKK